jgi:hypothetical protein
MKVRMQALNIMQRRGCDNDQCRRLGVEFLAYSAGQSPYDLCIKDGMTPVMWWKCLDDGSSNPLITLAVLLLNISPTGAFVERVFSIMGLIKSKLRNRLSVSKLKKAAIIRVHHQHMMSNRDTRAGYVLI